MGSSHLSDRKQMAQIAFPPSINGQTPIMMGDG